MTSNRLERVFYRLPSRVGVTGSACSPQVSGRATPRPLYRLDKGTLHMITCSSTDPTRASIPLHLAVNGSLEIGHTVGVVLAGDATEL